MSNSRYGGSDIRHSYGYTSTTKTNRTPYYITQSDDELIDFQEMFGENVHANYLTITSVDTELLISLNDKEYLNVIPVGHTVEYSYTDITCFRVCNPVSTKIRWEMQGF